MNNEFSSSDLEQFYADRLRNAGVSSVSALVKATESGSMSLAFESSRYISPEKQQEILRDNPDSVVIGEKSFAVTYTYDYYYKEHTASIKIPIEEIFDIDEIPVLPSGRRLEARLTDSRNEVFSGSVLDDLKAKAENHLLTKQWEAFKYSANAPNEQKLNAFDPVTDNFPELPEPITFGTNIRTHESALAYPALTYTRPYWTGDSPYVIVYYKTQSEAQRAHDLAVVQIEFAKEEKRKDDERNAFLSPARAVFSEIEVPQEENSMIDAFRRATELSADAQSESKSNENVDEEETGELSAWKRKKLEARVSEAELKIEQRLEVLQGELRKEKASAIDLTGGEAHVVVSTPGTKVLILLNKKTDNGDNYAEVVEWPTNRVLHLQASELRGRQYVEVVETVESGGFHSDDLDLDGITLRVKKVDLAEDDEIIKAQQDKIRKLRKRLD